MKKFGHFFIAILFAVSTSYASDFSPTLLKLSYNPIITYDFDGSELEIPVDVSGTPAGIIFYVFTKYKAAEIGNMVNGYLGWHQVNKVDTCIYYSSLKSVGAGATTITWDGRNQDGALVPDGLYTYYMWAFDNQSDKLEMCDFLTPNNGIFAVMEKDESGLPLANPIFYEAEKRWTIGNDPLNESLMETCSISLYDGWKQCGKSAIDPKDFNCFYIRVDNTDEQLSGIQKYKWIPDGDAELQTDYGYKGLSELFNNVPGGGNTGVVAGRYYMYTADDNHASTNEPDADFYIYDLDGYMIYEIDITGWWSNPDDLEAGAQMNGGPNDLYYRNRIIFLNCSCSCIKQMIDPLRYLDSDKLEDLFVWTNRNGDYVLDHNFEETAVLPWVCNDFNVGPYTYNISADDNLFSQCVAYDVGGVSFGLLAPDGSGLGYFAFAGEIAGRKSGNFIIDGETPFDGMYCDDMQHSGTICEWGPPKINSGIYFIGHDSIRGVIRLIGTSVEEKPPRSFILSQNYPNPFNPVTSIPFTLPGESHVSLTIYSVTGKKVAELADNIFPAGKHSVEWDASGFSSGVYFYRLKAGNFEGTGKMTVMK